jgi:transcriptional regulator with XRE-family HTH domain
MTTFKARIKLAKRIKQIRKKRGLSQEETAYRSSIDLRLYQRAESKKPPALQIDTIERIAKGLRVSLHKLFDF